MDYFHENWIGFLANFLITKCVKACKDRCPGCEIKLRSPILHKHDQFSLLDKIRIHFDEIKGILEPHLETIYDIVQGKLPHSSDLEMDKVSYCKMGQNFLLATNPDSLYWGRYVTEFNDFIVFEMMKLCLEEGKRLESLNKVCKSNGKKRKDKTS